ncbi:hypothetical protein [Spirosoma rhododendri]|uniref:Carboxypeptidase regulatory-like domain-containing protein n=1 Tax=Spirosoma rhododendri TaxID=2728024 RepID=A0A7L5DQJ5_9BACT|nr:hypothetical protein [Spirosoma rhododendri]QJD79493.1 hypothetical protein HH216_14570 [Spirosoma rhododendri]
MKAVLVWLMSGSVALAQTIVPRTLVQLSVDHDDVYLAGEPIVGQARIINALTGQPDSTDVALYVDCINADQGAVLRRVIVRPRNGLAHFTLTPPDSLPSYHCQLRAYTNWMRNFSPDAFGRQSLLVVSPTDQQRLAGPVTAPSVSSVVIRPEGGALVAGLRNRLVICARDTFGVGVPAGGCILASTGDTLTKLTTDDKGLASADLSPQPQTAYWAVLGGKRVALPPIQPTGSVLRCNDLTYPDRIRVTVENSLSPTPDTLTFIVQSRGRILSYASVPRQTPVSVFNIARSSLPPGLISLVLVDKQKKRVGERLIYKPYPAGSDDTTEPVDLELDQPLPSLSPQQLSDALVLRRNTLFGWDELTAERTYTFPAERGISLSGQLAKWNDKPVGAPVMVSLVATPVGDDSLSQRELFVAQSDASGRFAFQDMPLYGTYNGQLTAKIGNIDTRIRLDSSTVPSIVAQPRPIDWRILPNAQTLVARYDTLLTTRQRKAMRAGTTLQAVTVKANKTSGIQQAVFSTKPGTVVSRTNVLSNGVGGMLSGIMPRYLEYRIMKYIKPDIKYYVDDVYQQGPLAMNDMAVGEIDHIDIHERDADTMMYNADIVVAIYTIRSTNLTRAQSDKAGSGQRVVLKGFQRNLASK